MNLPQDDLLTRIKTEIRIDDLYPPLKGKKLIICPFHEDTHPSLSYSPEKNRFKCHGCGARGSNIDFLMHLNGWSKAEAIANLKRMFNGDGASLPSPRQRRPKPAPDPEKIKQRLEVLERVTDIAFSALWKSDSGIARTAKTYYERRFWSEDVLKNLRVGLLDLSAIRASKAITDEDSILAGFARKGKLLVNAPRLWLPVIVQDRIQYGCLARFLKNDNRVKYLHLGCGPLGIGSSSFIYNADGINPDKTYLCEGFADTITALSQGVPAVGTIGKRLPNPAVFQDIREVVIIPHNDSDGGGLRAALEHAQVIQQHTRGKVQVLRPFEGMGDLNDFICAGHSWREVEDYPMVEIPDEKMEGSETSSISPKLTLAKNTELGNARRFVVRHGQNFRYCHPWNKWLVWKGTHWARDDTAEVERAAKNTVADIYFEASKLEDDNARKTLAKWAIQSETASKIRNMIVLAESEPGIPVIPNDLDTDPWLLNVINGTLDLRTGKLRPHRQKDLITKIAPIVYDPLAQCPLWDAFLDRIMEGKQTLIDFLKRAVGYGITGDNREQVIFILYGTGANGKSTFLQTISAVLGDYALHTPTETFLIKRHDSIPSDVARLKGARFVTAIEAEEGKRLAESRIKAMTGGDTISARFLFGEWFEFVPTYKVFLGTNHKPIVKETTNAIWRRIRLIPFTVTIPEAEQDKGLLGKLQGELSGILRWAVEGCLTWEKEGLGTPPEVQQATHDYRVESDLVEQFLADCTRPTKTANVKASELYKTYREWCEKSGEKPMSGNNFSNALTERGLEKKRTNDGRYYVGVSLLNTSAGELDF